MTSVDSQATMAVAGQDGAVSLPLRSLPEGEIAVLPMGRLVHFLLILMLPQHSNFC